jgi:hypothetical protein
MKRYVAILVLAACGESDEERLHRFEQEADTQCWHHLCLQGPGDGDLKPRAPTEEGVACMNDALATGARAAASWGVFDYSLTHGTQTRTHLFTIEHEVRMFSTRIISSENHPPEVHVEELPSCDGPVRIGPEFCMYRTGDPDGPEYLPINALAVDGCPPESP